jgi:small-conductance mechanosensitive channel
LSPTIRYRKKRVASQVGVGVSYDSDPTRVEQVLSDIATAAIGHVPGLLKDPAPSVRLIPGFGDSSLNFSLNFHVAEYTEQYLVQHELRKRILRRFREEGIEIPFPPGRWSLGSHAGSYRPSKPSTAATTTQHMTWPRIP